MGVGAKGREGWSPDGPTELANSMGGGHVLCGLTRTSAPGHVWLLNIRNEAHVPEELKL